MSSKGGTGGGGLVHPESENSMAMYGLAVKYIYIFFSGSNELIISSHVWYIKAEGRG